MKEIIKDLRKLKSGQMCIPDINKRFAIMGILNSYHVDYECNGSIIWLTTDKNVLK